MRKKITLILVLVMVLSFSIVGCAFESLEKVQRPAESPEMVLVPEGTAADGRTSISYDIKMGKYEVTFQEYIAFCNDTGKSVPDDEGWGKSTRPIMNVSWHDAVEYCNWLSEQEGLTPAYDRSGAQDTWSLKDDPQNVDGYRLPTETEWQYAALGGANGNNALYAGSYNIDDVAWYNDNSGRKTHPVGEKQANELGIYDMSGNVDEWTNPPKGSGRVIRGGSYRNYPNLSRVGRADYRNNTNPSDSVDNLGFRLTKTK